MRKLSFIIFLLAAVSQYAQSPHGDINIDCAKCHTTEDWKVDLQKMTFDHSSTGFELENQHKTTDCKSCHQNLKFEKTPQNCFSCHTDIHENTVGVECQNCHTTKSWIVTNIIEIHSETRFPLIGAHAVTDCEQCHQSSSGRRFEPIDAECYQCHQKDYASAQNPNHVQSGFSTDCEMCHNMGSSSWNQSTFAHDFFPLIGGHAIGDCFACHTNGNFGELDTDCYTCHQTDYNAAANPNHTELQFSTNCNDCHSMNPGWQPANFAQHDQIFPLTGAHAQIANDCASCHANGYTNTPDQCFGCHESNYNSTTNPPHQQNGFSTGCDECHSTSAWTPATFDHDGQYFPIYSGKHAGTWNLCSDCHTVSSDYAISSCITCHEHNQNDTDSKHNNVNGYIYESTACFDCHPTGSAEGDGAFSHSQTNFPLTGGHVGNLCSDCHIQDNVTPSMECSSCHQADADQTADPNHKTLNFPQNCNDCHTNEPGWQIYQFTIHDQLYPLTGGHSIISGDCSKCHESGYNATTQICNDCHTSDYNSSQNPKHADLTFPTDCDQCHTTQPGWSPAEFTIHDQFYPLLGAHANVNDCATCHNGDYNQTTNVCYDCHTQDYQNTTDPAHQSSGFDTDCSSCHSETAWKPSTFDHDNQYFPIYSGKHNNEWSQCADCHTISSDYGIFSCIDCHEHNQSDTDSKHRDVNGYVYDSFSCYECHPTGRADDGAFNHSTTNFPLIGSHVGIVCSDCHTSGSTNISTLCNDCHNADFNGTTDPDHQALSFSTNCETCHNAEPGWPIYQFTIHDQIFALTGAHAPISNECSKCHSDGYSSTSDKCSSCHLADFNGTTDPNHQTLNFSENCDDCHTNETGWQIYQFSGHDQYFALTGSHATISNDCAKCHDNGYSSASENCAGCHIDAYNTTSNPDHQSAGIDQNCENCHQTGPGWSPADYTHGASFTLIGAHTSVNDCASCHNGDFTTAPSFCYDCHGSDYTSVTDPPHSGFSTDCTPCHSQNAWTPSTFDHDGQYFPIYSGKHRREWNSCSDCHTVQSDYGVFSCIDCHEHNQSEMDSKHREVSNYVYQSTACYDCHPNGDSDRLKLKRIPRRVQ